MFHLWALLPYFVAASASILPIPFPPILGWLGDSGSSSSSSSTKNPFSAKQIQRLVVFGDSYSVQNVGDGRIQWPDWVASPDYANVELFDFAQSGATCSEALTPRTFPAIMQDELPLFTAQQQNGTLPKLNAGETLFAAWIGTNDVGRGVFVERGPGAGGHASGHDELCRGVGAEGVRARRPELPLVERTSTPFNSLVHSYRRRWSRSNGAPMLPQLDAYISRYYTIAHNATLFHYHDAGAHHRGGTPCTRFMLSALAPTARRSHSLLMDVIEDPQSYLNGTAPFNVTGRASVLKSARDRKQLSFLSDDLSPYVCPSHRYADIDSCDRLFLVGTTLATFSAFRLLKHALTHNKPVLMLNVGPTRADGLPGLEKIEVASGLVLRDVVKTVLGSQASDDPIVAGMLTSGIVKRPPEDDAEIDA
ncbi:hypothetical protein EUX98_g7858 [Antrodiella citrinella]|uniref:Deacetylase sirtuin-type domain-containing protein n=1 Tax=Antrodiella citrinella TaxID=2447956 RepID=A0A4S4MKT2_9APHY|nr:hypothetical protein EUX98_g7858 [Antrodiella citrinella]